MQKGKTTEEVKTKFTREFIDDDGIKSIWKYDLNITTSGPISTEQIFPKNMEIIVEEEIILNESLPMSKRKFWSEATQKWVGYTRGLALGLVPGK
jgi:hypothetical protein